jgi:hypothetical protein
MILVAALQIPNHEIPSERSEKPDNPKKISNDKIPKNQKASGRGLFWDFVHWNLEFFWDLEFRDLGFST